MLSALASNSALDHPLLVERENPKRAAVLVVTSDRGLAGGYNANVLREAEELQRAAARAGQGAGALRHRPQGRELLPVPPARGGGVLDRVLRAADLRRCGRGGRALVRAFLAGAGERDDEAAAEFAGRRPTRSRRGRAAPGLHRSSSTWSPRSRRRGGSRRWRSSTPTRTRTGSASRAVGRARRRRVPGAALRVRAGRRTLLDALLPKYIGARLFAALLESAASESAHRQRAMKAATDNANELIRNLTLESNQARQAQITQEISEIVGGADALVERRK